ncbi:MAG: 4Fe-4S binding protein [Anaerovoracaceae bacterium]
MINNVVKCTVAPDEVKRIKALGFLRDKTTADKFNCRVLTRNGKITSDEALAIAQAAEKFGNGELTFTSRLTTEIQAVPYDKVDQIVEFLGAKGLKTGGTGAKVRPIVSCKGTTCQYGLIDAYKLSEEIHNRFFLAMDNVALPHKFKIAVGGCPNSCVKPDLNDLGVVGQRNVLINMDKCRGCKVCQIVKSCPIKIATMKDGKVFVDQSLCNNCGRCLNVCPFGAFEEYETGYKITIGGRWGKKTAIGQPLSKLFASEEEVFAVIENAIKFFETEGIKGERFSDTIQRLGFEYVESKLI